MKKTKQNWIKENYIYLVIICSLVLLLLWGFWYDNYSTRGFCKNNPDKCVCEKTCRDYDLKGEPKPRNCPQDQGVMNNLRCSKFRLKTQAELDIDDCNNNPREDDLCKCIQFKCQKWLNISGEYKWIYNFHTSKKGYCAEVNSPLGIISNEQCSQSRPKTECEKGNENWITETKINQVDTSIVPHPECKLQTGWFCPGIGIVNLPCDNSTGRCILESGLSYIGCEYESDICISNQTICREEGVSK